MPADALVRDIRDKIYRVQSLIGLEQQQQQQQQKQQQKQPQMMGGGGGNAGGGVAEWMRSTPDNAIKWAARLLLTKKDQ